MLQLAIAAVPRPARGALWQPSVIRLASGPTSSPAQPPAILKLSLQRRNSLVAQPMENLFLAPMVRVFRSCRRPRKTARFSIRGQGSADPQRDKAASPQYPPPAVIESATRGESMSERPAGDDDMPVEIDSSQGFRGLHHIPAGAKVFLPASSHCQGRGSRGAVGDREEKRRPNGRNLLR